MNSTQTDSSTATATDEKPKRSLRSTHLTAQLWMALLNQTEWWVPRGAWDAYNQASRTTLWTVEPNFTVDGVVAVADMGMSWRQSVTNFMWRKSVGITYGMSLGGWFLGGNPYAPLDGLEEDSTFAALSRDQRRRRDWFDQLPLIAHLRESIITERDARVSRPVLLHAAPTPAHPSGLILSR